MQRQKPPFSFQEEGEDTRRVAKWGKGDGYVWVSTTSVTLMSCYVSPNCAIHEYERLLEDMKYEITKTDAKETIIGGDFNAKSALWESAINDQRGEILSDLIGELNLVVINQGKVPTFRRGNSHSIIDVTLATPGIAAKIRKWRVDDEAENLSDHNNIHYEISGGAPPSATPTTTRRWRVTEQGLAKIGELATK